MKVLRTIAEVRAWRRSAGVVGFAPTMGALHEGHLSLIRASASECESTAISIFVNPLQFGPNEDLSKYPRQEETDLELAENAGAHMAFVPSRDEIYQESHTIVHVSKVSESYEGAQRPGHFDGVATVVLKLFQIVQPDSAYFGWKDLQQCAVIRQMTHDLHLNLELKFKETVREPDGLAMSSRNVFLSPSGRNIAAEFPRQLTEAVQKLRGGIPVQVCLEELKHKLSESGFGVDYAALVDPVTMREMENVAPGARLMSAIRWEGVRLLDNHPLEELQAPY